MDIASLFGKINELQQKMEDVKRRLDTVSVDGSVQNGAVTVHMTANKKVTQVIIDNALMNTDRKEELEELLETAFNLACEQATRISESEMKAAGKGMLPGIPGLF
jgi:nucleoid-associated protein EbfC